MSSLCLTFIIVAFACLRVCVCVCVCVCVLFMEIYMYARYVGLYSEKIDGVILYYYDVDENVAGGDLLLQVQTESIMANEYCDFCFAYVF